MATFCDQRATDYAEFTDKEPVARSIFGLGDIEI